LIDHKQDALEFRVSSPCGRKVSVERRPAKPSESSRFVDFEAVSAGQPYAESNLSGPSVRAAASVFLASFQGVMEPQSVGTLFANSFQVSSYPCSAGFAQER
jgi:hypothetical protein